jgi:hypothetical protein
MTKLPPLPLAVRLRDDTGPPLPQMVAQRRATLKIELQGCEHCGKDYDLQTRRATWWPKEGVSQ